MIKSPYTKESILVENIIDNTLKLAQSFDGTVYDNLRNSIMLQQMILEYVYPNCECGAITIRNTKCQACGKMWYNGKEEPLI